MKLNRTWILIADAGRSRVLQRDGKNGRLEEVEGCRLEEHIPPTHEIVADRQGRTMVSGGANRHAYAQRTDPHREAKRTFVQRVAATLDGHLAAGDFDRLIVVAPPQALGDLRSALSPQVAARVTGDLDKDLTKVPDHEVTGHLGDLLLGG